MFRIFVYECDNRRRQFRSGVVSTAGPLLGGVRGEVFWGCGYEELTQDILCTTRDGI